VMSFSVASCFTCSPRGSSASATSASSPTDAAPPCCHVASPLSTPLHRKTNRNPRPHQPGPCGAVPSAAGRWLSSNDSPRHKSNSVLHRSWLQLHELTRSHTALATLQSVSPKCASLPSRHLLSISAWAHFRHELVFAQCVPSLSTRLDRSCVLLHSSLAPFNLHKSRVRRASGFLLTAFSNATPHTLSLP
jgi:hypothetical protein